MVVRIGGVEPSKFLINCLIGVIRFVVVLGAELWLHGIDEQGGVVVAPLCELGDVEGNKHAVRCQTYTTWNAEHSMTYSWSSWTKLWQ
jgi:hypothetical protein